MTDIRKAYNVSVGLIHKILESNGIKPEADREMVMKAYREGVSPQKIRRDFGLSVTQFRNIITRKG